MKAFLLAAGLGTRLAPLTDHIPKCLLPIRGQPLLGIWLELLRRGGINEVLINLHAHADAVRTYLGGANHGLKMRLFDEPTLLGSAGTLAANRSWVDSEEFFWVCYADVLTNLSLEEMLRFHLRHGGAATLGVYEVPDPSCRGIVAVDQEKRITQFIEKPRVPPSNLAFSGILIATPALLDAIPATLPADLGFDVLPHLVGRVFAYPVQNYLIDIGTPENYQKAEATWPGLRLSLRTEG